MFTRIIQNVYHVDIKKKIRNTDVVVTNNSVKDVVTWLAQASCRFLVGSYHMSENERTDCLYDGERGKGEAEYFCS